MNITKEKLELIQKILNARLSATELSAVKDKAKEMLNRRKQQ